MEVGSLIEVDDTMQTGYRYTLSAPLGDAHSEVFQPFLSPKEMLEMGVFEGKYCNDCTNELPEDWFQNAKISAQPEARCKRRSASGSERSSECFYRMTDL